MISPMKSMRLISTSGKTQQTIEHVFAALLRGERTAVVCATHAHAMQIRTEITQLLHRASRADLMNLLSVQPETADAR